MPNGGTWIGTVVPQTSGPTCTQSRGIAQISAEGATFIPNEGTWTLIGTAEPDGVVNAEKIVIGANKQPFETRLAARIRGNRLVGTYTTPRCTFTVDLTRR